MDKTIVYCGQEALQKLIIHCRAAQPARLLVVADEKTYRVLGQRVEAGLREQTWDVHTVILHGAPLVADERSVMQLLLSADGQPFTYVAVGSGTITDITRYASYCARTPFIAMPTAPSMDAYTSPGAALVIAGVKLTVLSHAPGAVFADLPTLCQAPHEMIAAGFGDMIGKYIALADWQLGALLLDEPYSAQTAQRAARALHICVDHAQEIGQATATGVTALMDAQLESGFCMSEYGGSRPASGFEHMISHFWEMKLAQEQRPSLLHGVKVGLGTVLAAQRYEALRALTPDQAVNRFAAAQWPKREEESARLGAALGPLAASILASYAPFLELLEGRRPLLAQRIGDLWPQILDITASVPAAARIIDLLRQVGAPTDPQQVSLTRGDVEEALAVSYCLRSRLTVDTLGRFLQLW